ncbi:MAG: hypothetical protein K2X66_06470, partial [Cyanobacteria bacterium]|nr:hypothetical protein [Cyanobacteriota bacterium]
MNPSDKKEATVFKIGLTMRVDIQPQTQEVRDAISQEWYAFLDLIFPGCSVVLIPNRGEHHPDNFLKSQEIDILILSGGNDVGSVVSRDQTEY